MSGLDDIDRYHGARAVAFEFLHKRAPRYVDVHELAHDAAATVLCACSPPPAKFDAFVRSVAWHQLCRMLRRRSQRASMGYLSVEPMVEDRVADAIDAAAVLRHDNTGLLRRLYVEGYTFAECCPAGLKRSAFKVRVKRARERARRAMLRRRS